MKKPICLFFLMALVMILCLSACSVEGTTSSKPETPATTTTAKLATTTTVDPATLSIFDPARYENADVATWLDIAAFENGGLWMEHRISMDESVSDDWYAVFVWQGEPVKGMPDFPSPENSGEWGQRHDCLQGGTGIDTETNVILFCEGVPNLGDYFLYNLPECPAVFIPDSVKSIGEHTFAENAITVIHCHAGSYAEQYAKDHGMKYEIVKE